MRHYTAIHPVLLWRPKASHPVQVGSAVLLRIGTADVLLTAAHVTDLRTEGKLCIHTSHGAAEFAGHVGANLIDLSSSRDDDPIDVGFLVPARDEWSTSPTDYMPIAPIDIDLNEPVNGGEFCCVAGFPVARKWAKHSGKELTGSRLTFVGIAFPATEYASRGYNPKTNILIEYHIDKAIYPEGDRAQAPSPRGMSGGGVFRLEADEGGNPDPSTARLIGIMHKYSARNRMFVATRIGTALRIFVEALPDKVRASIEA